MYSESPENMPRSNRVAHSSGSLYPTLNPAVQETSFSQNPPPLPPQPPPKLFGPDCDLVLVFKDKLDPRGVRFLQNLERLKFDIRIEDEQDDSKLKYVRLRTPADKLLEIAEIVKFKVAIKKYEFKTNDVVMDDTTCFALPSEFQENLSHKTITAPYTETIKAMFPKEVSEEVQNMLPKDRSYLTYEILLRCPYKEETAEIGDRSKDKNIGIDRLLSKSVFLTLYPMHERLQKSEKHGHMDSKELNDREILWHYWAKYRRFTKLQPLHIICRYLGEKLAFYFAFIGYYTSSLLLPTLFGFLALIYGLITFSQDLPTKEICNSNSIGGLPMCPLCDDEYCVIWRLNETCIYSRFNYLVDNPATIVYSILVSVWSVIFIDTWKRRENKLQFKWDVHDFEAKTETMRPQFESSVTDTRKNLRDQDEPYLPLSKKFFRNLISYGAALFGVLVVIAFIFGVIVYRVVIRTVFAKLEYVQSYSSVVVTITSAIINLVIIVILSNFYGWLAVKLTDFELQKTDSMYERSLTTKMFLFQFVNFYSSVIYVAFFKGRNLNSKIDNYDLQEKCDQSGCFMELCIQLIIIMVGKQIWNQFQEIFVPQIKLACKSKKRGQPDWVKDYKLLEWGNLTLFEEYLEMVIQYGFIAMFSLAFPLAPLFAFLNNILEVRIDARKVLTQYRRPLAKKVQSIGIWMKILDILCKLGIIMNAALIAFTSDFIPRVYYMLNDGDGSLKGYNRFVLTTRNMTDYPKIVTDEEICYYRDFRYGHNDEKQGFTPTYFYILVARLTFVIAYEHVVFFLVTILHMIIPDQPKRIKEYIDHEDFLLQQALSERKPKKKGSKKWAQGHQTLPRIASSRDSQMDQPLEEENENNFDVTEFPGYVSTDYPAYNMRTLIDK